MSNECPNARAPRFEFRKASQKRINWREPAERLIRVRNL